MLTVFDNDLSAVPADKASVTVAHTAAVPPADIVVNDAVLFPNVANGESLTLVVPVDTYSVQIVPTGEEGPAILGPLDLTVEGGSLNRVFAVGNPEDDTMNVVHVPEFAEEGSETPEVGDRTAVDRVTTGRMANGRTVGGLVAACLLLAGCGSSPEPTPAAAAVIAPDQSEATTDAGQAEESLIEVDAFAARQVGNPRGRLSPGLVGWRCIRQRPVRFNGDRRPHRLRRAGVGLAGQGGQYWRVPR